MSILNKTYVAADTRSVILSLLVVVATRTGTGGGGRISSPRSSDCSIRLLNGPCRVVFYDGVPSGYQTWKNKMREKDTYLRKEDAHEYQVIVFQERNNGENQVEMLDC